MNMIKKRINHRVAVVDIDRDIIIGGYNEEEKTLAHVEIVHLVKKEFLIHFDIGYSKQEDDDKVKEGEVIKEFPDVIPPLNDARQNFGVTVLKYNQQKLKDPSQ